MGWTSTYYNKRLGGLRAFFEERFNGENEHGVWKVLDFAAIKRGQECYLALYRKDKATGKEDVSAEVVMCKFSRDEYYNITYKECSEYGGPYLVNCPERLLKQLGPIDPEEDRNGWAKAWREKCWENVNARKANRGKFKVGDIVRFTTPLKFTDGVERDEFTVTSTKPLRFRSGTTGWGATVRITRSALRDPSAYTLQRG